MSTPNTQRSPLRKQRLALSAKHRKHSAFLASRHLYKLHTLLPKNAKIGIYLDGFGELPTAPLLAFCQRYGYQAYLPIAHADKPLTFAPVMTHFNKTPLKKHRLGMYEPITKPHISADKLDMIICPLVAIDNFGNRMGMGGGFYDRTLEHWHKHKEGPYPIGLAHDCQEYAQLPTAEWDVPLAEVITPTRRLLANNIMSISQ
jgi:5-formyltetrahydrofolate cyclo-ligase